MNAFHAGEQALQARAGVQAQMAQIGPRVMRDHMPDQHREFFGLLPFVVVGSVDAWGQPWASVLAGAPGFMDSPDPTHLQVRAQPLPHDPLNTTLHEGAALGLLGIQPHTRRRNRVNGRVSQASEHGFEVKVEQTVGNCPQYIQTRTVTAAKAASTAGESPAVILDGLDEAARDLIESADTFFVASRGRSELGAEGGFDMSHRGGRPGFVAVQGDTLVIPDFRGNGFFNTLGNLLGDPRAGLLFIDFNTGDLLQLQGTVAIDWQPEGSEPAWAERLWRVQVKRAWRTRSAFASQSTFGEFAPSTLHTGTW
eukprot:gene40094-52966_t